MRIKEYQKIVDTWSSIYKAKIGSLFTIEELKQEAWLAVMEVLDAGEEADNTAAYLAQAIRFKLIDMIDDELKFKTQSLSSHVPDRVTPEDLITQQEIIVKLKVKLKDIPNIDFIIDCMQEGYSIRDISVIAQQENLNMDRNKVYRAIKKIRAEYEKITGEKYA